MAKTVTLRLPDDVYEIIKTAASGQKRSISNFIEVATLAYLVDDSYAPDEEMEELLKDTQLRKTIEKGKQDIENSDYRIIE